MNRRRLSVRTARMELEFALVEGNEDKIKKAEQELAEALAESAEAAKRSSSHDADGNKD